MQQSFLTYFQFEFGRFVTIPTSSSILFKIIDKLLVYSPPRGLYSDLMLLTLSTKGGGEVSTLGEKRMKSF